MGENSRGLKSALIAGKSVSEIAEMLVAEWRHAPSLTISMPPEVAYCIAGLLQLACQHRLVGAASRELAQRFIEQIAPVGPVTAAAFQWGWESTQDD